MVTIQRLKLARLYINLLLVIGWAVTAAVTIALNVSGIGFHHAGGGEECFVDSCALWMDIE